MDWLSCQVVGLLSASNSVIWPMPVYIFAEYLKKNFVVTLQTTSGTFHQREKVTLQTSCGAERVNSHTYGNIHLSSIHNT